MNLDDLPPGDLDRLDFYRACRAAEALEEEKERVEALLERRRSGERLAEHEEAAIAYSPWGTAAGCGCR